MSHFNDFNYKNVQAGFTGISYPYRLKSIFCIMFICINVLLVFSLPCVDSCFAFLLLKSNTLILLVIAALWPWDRGTHFVTVICCFLKVPVSNLADLAFMNPYMFWWCLLIEMTKVIFTITCVKNLEELKLRLAWCSVAVMNSRTKV